MKNNQIKDSLRRIAAVFPVDFRLVSTRLGTITVSSEQGEIISEHKCAIKYYELSGEGKHKKNPGIVKFQKIEYARDPQNIDHNRVTVDESDQIVKEIIYEFTVGPNEFGEQIKRINCGFTLSLR